MSELIAVESAEQIRPNSQGNLWSTSWWYPRRICGGISRRTSGEISARIFVRILE